MFQFTLRRLAASLATILVASLLLFSIMHLLPGDEVRALFPSNTTRVPQDVYDRLVRQLHYDRSLPVQYWYFLRDLLTLDFGRTMPSVSRNLRDIVPGAPIRPMLLASLQVSGRVLAGVVVLQVLLAPAIAWVAGRRPESWSDRLGGGLSVALVSIPVLAAAILVQTALSYWTHVVPSPIWNGTMAGWQNYGPPILALGLGAAGHLAVVGREEVVAVLAEPHARFAEAIGLPAGRVVRRAMRPTIARMAQVFGANLAAIGTGLIIVEDIFRVPGLGSGMLAAIHEQQRSVIVTLLMVILALAIAISTLADIAHAWLDPRVRDRALTGRTTA